MTDLMTGWWMILFIVLWLFVMGEAFLLWGVLRQVGLLHRRIDALRNGDSSKPHGLEIGTAAPDFTLPRLDGGHVLLRELRGRAVILAFIQPSCGPCKSLLPHINALVTQVNPQFAQVLLITNGGVDANEQLRQQFEIAAPLLLQTQGEVAESYRANFTPFVYAIDQMGIVRAHRVAHTEYQLIQLLATVTEIGPQPAQLNHAAMAVAQ